MIKNPHIVTYKDLIKDVSESIEWMERTYPVKIAKGDILKSWADRKLLIKRRLFKLLKQYDRNPQLDLYAVHESIKMKEQKH